MTNGASGSDDTESGLVAIVLVGVVAFYAFVLHEPVLRQDLGPGAYAAAFVGFVGATVAWGALLGWRHQISWNRPLYAVTAPRVTAWLYWLAIWVGLGPAFTAWGGPEGRWWSGSAVYWLVIATLAWTAFRAAITANAEARD